MGLSEGISKVFLGVFIAFLLSCTNDDLYADLAQTYLNEIANENWEAVYSCKSKEFKNLVAYDVFLESMGESSKSYRLKNYSVKAPKFKTGTRVRIVYTFTLGDPETDRSLITMEDQQIWEVFSGGHRVCRDLGMSAFFPFNADTIVGRP